jgi:hypothetical protein
MTIWQSIRWFEYDYSYEVTSVNMTVTDNENATNVIETNVTILSIHTTDLRQHDRYIRYI